MTDKFENMRSNLESPAEGAAEITPDDSTDLTQPSRALYVGTGGDVAVQMIDGTSATFAGVAGGSFLPLRVDRVLATGTTASGIVAIY